MRNPLGPPTLGCPSVAVHPEHVWADTRFGRVLCHGLNAEESADLRGVALPEDPQH
jgi:hypothetical protein